MAFQIKIDESAVKELKKIDPQHAREILRFLRDRIAPSEDPRVFGKPLIMN